MKKVAFILLAVSVSIALSAGDLLARGSVEGPVIYVTGQDLFYDSIVTMVD